MQGLALMLTQHPHILVQCLALQKYSTFFFFVQRHIYLCTMEKEEGIIEVLGINDMI